MDDLAHARNHGWLSSCKKPWMTYLMQETMDDLPVPHARNHGWLTSCKETMDDLPHARNHGWLTSCKKPWMTYLMQETMDDLPHARNHGRLTSCKKPWMTYLMQETMDDLPHARNHGWLTGTSCKKPWMTYLMQETMDDLPHARNHGWLTSCKGTVRLFLNAAATPAFSTLFCTRKKYHLKTIKCKLWIFTKKPFVSKVTVLTFKLHGMERLKFFFSAASLYRPLQKQVF